MVQGQYSSTESVFSDSSDMDEEVGIGGLPTETQLVLLCLDYLRDLRRSYSAEDLHLAEGIDADWLSVSIYALSRSFVRPNHLCNQNSAGNDAWFDRDKGNVMFPGTFPPPEVKISKKSTIQLPTITSINREIFYSRDPNSDHICESDVGTDLRDEDHVPEWHDYDDTHLSNSDRFYPLNGLASGPQLNGPLTLGEITAAGLAGLGARSRSDAEREMIKSPLFEQFVSAVRSKGFFQDPDTDTVRHDPAKEEERQRRVAQVYDERFRKVVGKFRTKLANKAQEQQNEPPMSSNLLALSAADRQRKRRHVRVEGARMRRKEALAKRYDNESTTPNRSTPRGIEETPPRGSAEGSPVRSPGDETLNFSVVTSLNKKLAPRTPAILGAHRVDLDEAERLKSQGNMHMQHKDYDKAVESYTAALKLSPAGPQSHVYFSNRAAALLSMKKFEEAILDSERSVALKSDYGKAHARLGLAHFLLANYRQAIEAYSVSLKYEPDNQSSRSYLEKAAKRLAKQEKGGVGNNDSSFSVVSEWSKSERRDVDQKEAEKFKLQGNQRMANRDYAGALDSYTAALQLCPNGPNSHVYYSNRAAALCYLERYHEAEADSTKSLELVPTYGKAHSRLGLSRFFMGNYAGAVEAYTDALKHDPDNTASKSYLAKAQARLDRDDASFADPSINGLESASMADISLSGTPARKLHRRDPDGFASPDRSELTTTAAPLRVKTTAAPSPDRSKHMESSPANSKASNGSADLKNLLKNPEMNEEAKKLMDDPEMQQMAKKAMADPSMVEAMMAVMNMN